MQHYDGQPVWHASVSLHDHEGPVPVANWTKEETNEAVEHLLTLLQGVGDVTTDKPQVGKVALHTRRKCTAVEKQQAPLLRLGEKPRPMPLN